MLRRKKILKWLGVVAGLTVLVAVVLAPSWRNYYFRRGSVRIVEDQVYVPGSTNPKHQMDLFLPTAGAKPWPVVVFVHGGFWKAQDRRLLQPITGLYGNVGVALANHGIATAVVSYRQHPEATSTADALDDLARAVRHVIDTIGPEGGDPTRVFIVGHSAGAMMTALLAVAPEHLERAGVTAGHVRGFACLSGVYDQARMLPALDADLAESVRRMATKDGDLERFSPERRVRPDHPPMLLLVGDRDMPVIVSEFQQMRAALRAVGGDMTDVEVPGEDHMDVVMHLSNANDRVLSELLSFIERHR